MSKTVLITGGAGFVGSHAADELLQNGYNVKIYDNLTEQVHGETGEKPPYLNSDAEFIRGDIRDREKLKKVLTGVDAVFHFAARVGVGQSMYEVKEYMDVNSVGTSVLLEELMQNPVEKLVVASSMSVYGEGMYESPGGNIEEGKLRPVHQMKKGEWEVYGSKNGTPLKPVAVTENKTPDLASVYALSKYDQERLCLMIGQAYDIPVTALRFFNIYGTRQALSNPYTGVLAIFAARYLNNQPPVIFEDGNQRRDFISVSDVANACRLALETEDAKNEVFNIGSGQSYTICEIATETARVLGKEHIEPEITNKYRVGDIRHCFADITKAQNILNFRPEVKLSDGLINLAEWLKKQVAVDKVNTARKELATRGLTI
ncbi:MAG: SDR family NAD(P)-dependent oxidoreductase [Balneolaceae bacterium]